jgi:hypothetical protein
MRMLRGRGRNACTRCQQGKEQSKSFIFYMHGGELLPRI